MPQPSLRDITVASIDALVNNQNARALELSCRAIAQYPQTGHLQRLAFVMACERTTLPAMAVLLKQAIEITLGYNDIENQRLFPGWFYLFKTMPIFGPFWAERPSWENIEPLLQDKFLIEGLRKLNFLDWELEQVFTRLRRDILLKRFSEGTLKTKHLQFLSALAEHCFNNEYIFQTEAKELEYVASITPDNPISACLIGCYKPLTNLQFDKKMSAISGFRSMVKTHVGNVREEQTIEFDANSQPVDKTTKNVQAMYEENPYPRWSNINMPHMKFEDIEADILLAGCGTGQMATGFSAALPNCSFTAIDISRTSLAYANRMAREHSIRNLEFVQLDILDAGKLGKKFDYIECSGVLHHMEDPESGWRALLSCLNTGGGMQVALYSAKTRVNIEAVRRYINQRGYKPVPDDIRRLRADIALLADDNPLKQVLRMRDFYSTSMTRDLLFHIQETAFTLPEISAMLDRLNLGFDGFKIEEGTKALYRARFKDDPSMTDLQNWELLEEDNPEIFNGMYRLFCHKKGDVVGGHVVRIREIQA